MGNNPMKTEVVLDLKRITAEVAARHGMLVRQDDPAMLLVTMNEVVLQQVFGRIEARRKRSSRAWRQAVARRSVKRWEVLRRKHAKPG